MNHGIINIFFHDSHLKEWWLLLTLLPCESVVPVGGSLAYLSHLFLPAASEPYPFTFEVLQGTLHSALASSLRGFQGFERQPDPVVNTDELNALQ